MNIISKINKILSLDYIIECPTIKFKFNKEVSNKSL